jgi:ech hydrogenase subunit D
MAEPLIIETIEVAALVDRVKQFRKDGYRLVQISATRLPEQVQVTYSFEREERLTNLRLHLPATEAKLPSVSGDYWCAFLYENELHDLFNINVEGIAVDFHGKFYNTAVKFPFATTESAAPKTAPASASPAVPNARPTPRAEPKVAAAAGT